MEHSPERSRLAAGLAAHMVARLPYGSVVIALALTAAAVAVVVGVALLLGPAPEPLISAPVRW